jgi:hypothetical protein
VLTWHEPESCGDLAAIAKVMPHAEGGHERRGVERPDSFHLPQALTGFQIATKPGEPLRHLGNGGIEGPELRGRGSGADHEKSS